MVFIGFVGSLLGLLVAVAPMPQDAAPAAPPKAPQKPSGATGATGATGGAGAAGGTGAPQAPAKTDPATSAADESPVARTGTKRGEKPTANGYELYSWRDTSKPDGETIYTLLQGRSGSVHTREEVTIPRIGFKGMGNLKKRLWLLAPEETVLWLTFHPRGAGPRFELPDAATVESVRKTAANYKLRIRVGESEPEDVYKIQQAHVADRAAGVTPPSVAATPGATTSGIAPPAAAPAAVAPATPKVKRAETAAMKGMDLYAWQGDGDTWRFALLDGTNREKKHADVIAAEIQPGGPDALKAKLAVLAVGEQVFYRETSAKEGGKSAVLPEVALQALVDYCKSIQVDLKRADG